MSIGKYGAFLERPSVEISNVTLPSDRVDKWLFVDLNVQVHNCKLDSVQMVLRKEFNSHPVQEIQNPMITVHNSSFKSLDLHNKTTAEILNCHINANMDIRPTLIQAMNSSILIQNSEFVQFVSDKGPTLLFANSNSHVTIENSQFLNHQSPQGIFYLTDRCFMKINWSLFSSNVANSFGFSIVSFRKDSRAIIKDTAFVRNSALLGGALIANGQCHVQNINCTFTANQAIAGGAIAILERTNLTVIQSTFKQNRVFQNEELIDIKLPLNQSLHDDLEHISSGGSISIFQGYCQMENSYFYNNAADFGGAIYLQNTTKSFRNPKK